MRALGTGFFAHMQRAVRGDEDGGNLASEAAAQFGDDGDAVAAVEVIVDQKTVRLETACLDGRQGLDEIGCLEGAATPAASGAAR